MRTSGHLQVLQTKTKKYFEEGAFFGASSFFNWFLCKRKEALKMKQKIKELTENQKMTIQLLLGTFMALFGVALLIASFVVPPLGIIDSSILAALGEVLTFSGSLIGIDYTYKYKRLKFEDEQRRKYNTDNGGSADNQSDA